MSNWRHDKKIVEKFIEKNQYVINHGIINILPKTRKNTWHLIKEDLRTQILAEYNRRQEIHRNRKQSKTEPVYDLEDVQLFENQELLNENIEKIRSADIAKDGLCIYFNNSDCKFKHLKNIIREKLNSINLEGLYLQISFRTLDGQIRFQTYSLMNETATQIINVLLNGKSLEYDFEVEEPNEIIEISGVNKEYTQTEISIKQITSIRIINPNNANKECKNKIYADNVGSFYIYKINKKFMSNTELVKKLERYQIFTSLNNKAFEENCLVYAIRQTNLFTEAVLNNMRTTCYTRYVSKKQLEKFGVSYNIKFNVVKYEQTDKSMHSITRGKDKYFGSDKQDAKKINLALINKHYVLNENVEGVSTFYINHYDDIENKCKDKQAIERFKISALDNKKYKHNKTKYHEIKSYDLIQFMTSDHNTWSFDDLCHLKNNLYEFNTNEIKDLNNFCDKDFKVVEKKEIKKENKEVQKIYFADTETDTSGDNHVAFCIAYAEQDVLDSNFNIISENKEIKFEFGRNCLNNFLDNIEDHALVYFHNLAYDIRQFNQFEITNQHVKGNKTMDAQIKHKGKTIYFKDSLSIVSMKLADFPSSFNLVCGEKEMFPYNYYTFENFEKTNCKGIISEAGKHELKHNWNQQQFEENLKKLAIVQGNEFDMVEYVKFYCQQDVRILKQGFQKFRKMCWESLKIDVNNELTAPSLANRYFTREIYEKVPDYYLYGGIVRSFIQKAVYGGRCMTRLNKRWAVNEELADFDAVSLYPSAMKRLYCVKGKCEVLQDEELDTNYLLTHTCSEDEQPSQEKPISTYIVEIQITNINKHLAFPCIVYKDKQTNTNRNDDSEIAIGKTAVVDNITLEDWVKFNGLECKIIRGYKWTGEKSF